MLKLNTQKNEIINYVKSAPNPKCNRTHLLISSIKQTGFCVFVTFIIFLFFSWKLWLNIGKIVHYSSLKNCKRQSYIPRWCSNLVSLALERKPRFQYSKTTFVLYLIMKCSCKGRLILYHRSLPRELSLKVLIFLFSFFSVIHIFYG